MKPILILDDYESITKMLSVQLKAHGYTSVSFNKPEDALEYLEKPENQLSMMIIDLYMPVINGLDFVTKVRDFHHHRLTPVAFLTSETSESIRKVTLAMPAVYEFITKPVDSKKLLFTIKSCMG